MIVLYEVGGAVRDDLLGLASKDIDYAVEASSYDEMRAWLLDEGFEIFLETPEYLTIRARFPREHPQRARVTADFVLCRKDGVYSDGRRPDTVQVGTIYDDLARRDFTVNAIARTMDGVIIDPHLGQFDLRLRELVCVGSAQQRFTEDALRALRAIRFYVTKIFTFNGDIQAALGSDWLPPLLASVSTERIREELTKCFHADTLLTMEIFHQYGWGLREAVFRDGLWLKPTLER